MSTLRKSFILDVLLLGLSLGGLVGLSGCGSSPQAGSANPEMSAADKQKQEERNKATAKAAEEAQKQQAAAKK